MCGVRRYMGISVAKALWSALAAEARKRGSSFRIDTLSPQIA